MDDDKLIKTVIIARSGIYKYRAEELANLGLDINQALEKKEVYNVYRPAVIMVSDKDKFAMLPLTNGHPKELVNSENFKQLTIGYTGEVVTEEWNSEQSEVVLKTKVALLDQQALENYYTGLDEVSLGYLATFVFENGTTSKGELYDIVMTAITQGNHLAMTPKARAGSVARIIDSEGGNMNIKKYASNLWRGIRRKLSGIKDSDMGEFRLICEEIANKKSTMSDEEIKAKIEQLQSMASDLPESDNKNILLKYLEDFGIIKEQNDDSAKLAADKVAQLYEQLDKESMEQGETMADENKNVPNTPVNAAPAQSEQQSPAVNKDDISLQYIAQELMKLAQAIMGDEEETIDEEETTETKKPEETPPKKTNDAETQEDPKKPTTTVADSMANIVVDSVNSKNPSLNEFFSTKIKKR